MIKRGVPADDNIYKVGETNFSQIKYDNVTDPTTGSVSAKSQIWDTGTMTFYLTGKCGRCLSIDWEWTGTNHDAAILLMLLTSSRNIFMLLGSHSLLYKEIQRKLQLLFRSERINFIFFTLLEFKNK